MRLFEYRVLRRMYGTTREEIAGGRRMQLGVEVSLSFVILPQTKEAVLECGTQLKGSKNMQRFVQITWRKG